MSWRDDPFARPDADAVTPRALRVLEVVTSIPLGRVMSYGDIAAHLGGCGPRQVAKVMAAHGDEVPWWRVLRADGRCAPEVRDRQLAHLRREGVEVSASGRVNMTAARHTPEE